jgi:hypothetical protein
VLIGVPIGIAVTFLADEIIPFIFGAAHRFDCSPADIGMVVGLNFSVKVRSLFYNLRINSSR